MKGCDTVLGHVLATVFQGQHAMLGLTVLSRHALPFVCHWEHRLCAGLTNAHLQCCRTRSWWLMSSWGRLQLHPERYKNAPVLNHTLSYLHDCLQACLDAGQQLYISLHSHTCGVVDWIADILLVHIIIVEQIV